jgi:hypothetical protein
MNRIRREYEGMKSSPRTTLLGLAIIVIVAVVLWQNPKLVTDVKTLLALATALHNLFGSDYECPDEKDDLGTYYGFPAPGAKE